MVQFHHPPPTNMQEDLETMWIKCSHAAEHRDVYYPRSLGIYSFNDKGEAFTMCYTAKAFKKLTKKDKDVTNSNR